MAVNVTLFCSFIVIFGKLFKVKGFLINPNGQRMVVSVYLCMFETLCVHALRTLITLPHLWHSIIIVILVYFRGPVNDSLLEDYKASLWNVG